MISKHEERTPLAGPEDPLVSNSNHFSAEQRFMKKWLDKVATDFRNELTLDCRKKEVNLKKAEKAPFSLRIAFFLNLLNYPLFILGISLLLWFFTEIILQYTLPEDLFQQIQAYSAPLISVLGPAAVGYWTNWLAIKMLFHPRRQNAVWWGLVHARREEIVESIAAGIMSSLISPEILGIYLHEQGIFEKLTKDVSHSLEGVLQEPEFRAELKTVLFNLVDRLVNNARTRELVDQYLTKAIENWRGESLGEKMMEWTKQYWGEAIRKQALDFLPEISKIVDSAFPRIEASLQTLPEKIEERGIAIEPLVAGIITDGFRSLDLKTVIREQLGKLDAAALEKLLTSNISGELVFIQTSGGIFGFLVGLAIIYQPLRLILAVGGLLVWGLYRLTVRKNKVGRSTDQS